MINICVISNPQYIRYQLAFRKAIEKTHTTIERESSCKGAREGVPGSQPSS